MSMNSFKPYWASVPSNEIADEILDRVDKYYKYLTLSGRMDLFRRSWGYYYKPMLVGSRVSPAGAIGELSSISVNHYRNLLLHLETLTTQQRAAFEPVAANNDEKSQAQVVLAAGLLDYYMREKRLERTIVQAVKDGLMFGEGFVHCEWDATAGKEYGKTPTGASIYQGDMKYTNYNPFNTIRDFQLETPQNTEWYILRSFVSKYDLAAKFPDLADRILADSKDAVEYIKTTTLNYLGDQDNNNIAIYKLIHKPSPALPNGRFTTCLDNGTVMQDGPLPYKENHVYRLAPDEQSGTIFGYTVGFDLLPIQETIDMMYSTITTNNATFGVQNVMVPKGSDFSTTEMSGGLNVVEYDSKLGKPEALNLTATSAETYNFVAMLEQVAETISGVNSVARGNPEASLKSGAALALVQSMAVQFSMGLQRSYSQLVEDLGTGTVNILKAFASVPRVAEIVGKSNRPYMKEFTGQDLDSINRVSVNMGNPLTATLAGRTNLAESLADRGMVDNPDQYIQVITTGRLEPVIQSKQQQLILIKGENEGLSEGIPQRAIITDNHAQHILEHSAVTASPEARQNPDSPIVKATLEHIQEHMNLAQSPGYQMIAAMLNHKVVPPPMPQPMPGTDGGTADMLNATPPMQEQQAGMPNMPSPPQGTDPASQAAIEAQPAPLLPQV